MLKYCESVGYEKKKTKLEESEVEHLLWIRIVVKDMHGRQNMVNENEG